MSTAKQRSWRLRSHMLWRIKGIPTLYNFTGYPMTLREKTLLKIIEDAKKELINNSTNSSIELGFNAKPRDILGDIITSK